jgi:hypothetical protein
MCLAAICLIVSLAYYTAAATASPNTLCPVAGCTAGGINWIGQLANLTLAPRFHRCCLPSARTVAASLSGRRIHALGDSTLRRPIQYFEREWLFCSNSTPPHTQLAVEERGLCTPPQGVRHRVDLLKRRMGEFALTFEPLQTLTVSELAATAWWKLWVVGSVGGGSRSSRTGAALFKQIPDAVVIGSWIWYAHLARTARQDGLAGGGRGLNLSAVLNNYELDLVNFFTRLRAQPSFARHWSAPGRLWWRAALPTEVDPASGDPQHSAGCAAANAVAARVIQEIAPSVRWLDQSSLVQYADHLSLTASGASVRGRARVRRRLTTDGIHYHGPVQEALGAHMLAAISVGLQK